MDVRSCLREFLLKLAYFAIGVLVVLDGVSKPLFGFQLGIGLPA